MCRPTRELSVAGGFSLRLPSPSALDWAVRDRRDQGQAGGDKVGFSRVCWGLWRWATAHCGRNSTCAGSLVTLRRISRMLGEGRGWKAMMVEAETAGFKAWFYLFLSLSTVTQLSPFLSI